MLLAYLNAGHSRVNFAMAFVRDLIGKVRLRLYRLKHVALSRSSRGGKGTCRETE